MQVVEYFHYKVRYSHSSEMPVSCPPPPLRPPALLQTR